MRFVIAGGLKGAANAMLKITDKAQGKVKEILESQEEQFAGLRVQIVGGGCSGFQYQMGFEKQANGGDEVLELMGFKVFVDKGSLIYLTGPRSTILKASPAPASSFTTPTSRAPAVAANPSTCSSAAVRGLVADPGCKDSKAIFPRGGMAFFHRWLPTPAQRLFPSCWLIPFNAH